MLALLDVRSAGLLACLLGMGSYGNTKFSGSHSVSDIDVSFPSFLERGGEQPEVEGGRVSDEISDEETLGWKGKR